MGCDNMSCHRDDFLAEGPAEGLDRLDEVMREGFEAKGLPQDWRSGSQSRNHLRRTLTSSDHLVAGCVHLASRSKVRKTPCQGNRPGRLQRSRHTCAKETGKNSRDLDKALTAGTALYLSFVWNSQANALHNLRRKRLGRYLAKYPTETWASEHQDGPKEILVHTDSNSGSCQGSQKSMSSSAIRLGSHLLDTSCSRLLRRSVREKLSTTRSLADRSWCRISSGDGSQI